ncbi:MAG: DNA mismatch repair protein MutS [Spirochaetales bacterium]|nr:DNA mismatch repair protein MutS [Spirochaetales bacterium]
MAVKEDEKELTPMVRQYMEIKKEHQDKVLFFRLGDFYEMFNEDAVEVSKLLNLTLTHRGTMPMCGIPYHAAKNYLKRLLDYGKKVAVCEQFLDPTEKSKLAKREVTQVYTPATVVDDEYLDSLSSSFVTAVNVEKRGVHIAWSDISTGEFYIRTLPLEKDFSRLDSLLYEISPKEILVPDDLYFSNKEFRNVIDATSSIVSKLPTWYFSLKEGRKQTEKQFSSNALRILDIDEKDPILTSIGALLSYLGDTAKAELPQLRGIERIGDESYMFLNSATIRNLEILTSLTEGGQKYSLYSTINRTLTPGGGRFLKWALVHPLVDISKILSRQEWVERFFNNKEELETIRRNLKETGDLERLGVKVGMKRATPRDLIAISESTATFIEMVENENEYLSVINDNSNYDWNSLIDFSTECLKAINRECTNINNDGTIINDGYDDELDSLRSLSGGGSKELDEYLEKIKAETGITTLKCGENRIIGCYLEVSKGQLDRVPPYFIRRQTLVGGERFTTEELNAIQERILSSKDEAARKEKMIYSSFVDKAYNLRFDIERMGKVISLLDFYSSLSYLATECSWVKPTLIESGELDIEEGRHPVVEANTERYVPNSFSTHKSRFSLITGPNMAGKSTYLREIALIVLLSHIGSYVPADSAEIPITDKIFCRVGASDNLSKGESTFLIEMSESAQILRSITNKSLVIMDEIGRGTSTQDGMSIAYAIMEYLKKSGAITLFATHYHELTMLDTSDMSLLHMDVKEEKGSVIFLRKAVEGVAASSYGIHVAKLAGMPRGVINEALSFQKKHFEDYSSFSDQGSLFASNEDVFDTTAENECAQAIMDFDLDQSTPLDALILIGELKKKLEEK